MLTIAYLANQYPSPVEHYVEDEIQELKRRGIDVIAGSVRKTQGPEPDIVLMPLSFGVICRAIWICLRRGTRLLGLVRRITLCGTEPVLRRIKALVHTFLGACYAARLQDRRVDHIHVHHGYFGAWIAIAAARLLNVDFSMTLHGSDLLINGAYLDVKLAHCSFCLTISQYNRRYILDKYPGIDGSKILVSRLGVELGEHADSGPQKDDARPCLLAVGRLHAVKDHAFLVRACGDLQRRGVDIECFIAGEGPERRTLENLIASLELENHVTLLGHVSRVQLRSLYDRADIVVLTSRSEGIPLVLMEAMAHGKIVLAPAITGIPELVLHGKTGFLYQAGSMDDFVEQLQSMLLLQGASRSKARLGLSSARDPLDWTRHAARVQVAHNFNRTKNLNTFAETFLSRIGPRTEVVPHEDLVLQQI